MTRANISQANNEIIRDDTDATTHPEEALGERRIKVWVFFNRNLQHYPLARHRRCKLDWKQSKKSGRWLCDLTNEIQVRLPANVTEKQKVAPSGFDIAITLALVREQRFKGKFELRLSGVDLLRAIGLPATGYNYQRLRATLSYLSQVRILMRHWYADGTRAPKLLLPPIQKLVPDGRTHWCITVNRQWVFKKDDGYCTRIPIDLPLDATAQGLLLFLWTQPPESPSSRQRRGKILLTTLYRKLGLKSDDNGRRALQAGSTIATQWLRDRGGDLSLAFKWCRFRAILPTVGQKTATRLRERERIERTVAKRQHTHEEFENAKRRREFEREVGSWTPLDIRPEPPQYDDNPFN